MNIYNINSKKKPSMAFVKKYFSYGYIFNSIIKNVNIYLVDPNLMDTIYPPFKDPSEECVLSLFKEIFRTKEETESEKYFDIIKQIKDKNKQFSEIFERCPKVVYPTLGCYVNTINSQKKL